MRKNSRNTRGAAMGTENIDFALVEALNENAETAEKEAGIMAAIAKRTAELLEAATDGDMDRAAEIIAKHDRDYSMHALIATTCLRSNKLFLTALVENVFPEAENIDLPANGVAFSWRGYDAEFCYCSRTGFDFEVPANVSPVSSNINTIKRVAEMLSLFDRDELVTNYETLMGMGLITEDFRFAGDKDSESESKTYFELATSVLSEENQAHRSFFRKMLGAAYQWRYIPDSPELSHFQTVCRGCAELEDAIAKASEYADRLAKWEDAYQSFKAVAELKGFPICNEHKICECDWTKMTGQARKSFLNEIHEIAETGKQVLAHWNDANFYKQYEERRRAAETNQIGATVA